MRMARQKPFINDQQWERIAKVIPLPDHAKGGRPRCNDRQVLEGILWILKTGAPWADLPDTYPSRSTCHRRLAEWQNKDVWLNLWRAFLDALDDETLVDWDECFADATFAPAKKGACALAKPSAVREQNLWWWSTARVFLWEASPRLLRRERRRFLSQRLSKSRQKPEKNQAIDLRSRL
jgi:transposase